MKKSFTFTAHLMAEVEQLICLILFFTTSGTFTLTVILAADKCEGKSKFEEVMTGKCTT